MRECKKCHEVKSKRKFFVIWHGGMYGGFSQITWLCKKCADEVGSEAMIKESEKYQPK